MHNSRQSFGKSPTAPSRALTQPSPRDPYFTTERSLSTAMDLVLCGVSLTLTAPLITTGAGAFAFGFAIAKCEYDLAMNLMPGSKAMRDDAKQFGELLSPTGMFAPPVSLLIDGGSRETLYNSAMVLNLFGDFDSIKTSSELLEKAQSAKELGFAFGQMTFSSYEATARALAIMDGVRERREREDQRQFEHGMRALDPTDHYVGDDPRGIDHYTDPPGAGDFDGGGWMQA